MKHRKVQSVSPGLCLPLLSPHLLSPLLLRNPQLVPKRGKQLHKYTFAVKSWVTANVSVRTQTDSPLRL